MRPTVQSPQNCDDRVTDAVLACLIAGGDDRILPGADGRNRYFAGATPFAGLAYGSSTISSISADALAHLTQHWADAAMAPLSAQAYADALHALRARLRTHYGTPDTAICFAPSGTDLEYVGLAAVPAGAGSICAILLGRDEVGSGCIHSAAGRHFAARTAVGVAVEMGAPIDARHAANRLVDVPIRDATGQPRASAAVTADIIAAAEAALAAGEYPVIHVVHGSKTGLTLPAIADCRALAAHFGNAARLVVDACQLRISPAMVRAYLAMGAVVLATGSKFAGGAPFSGFALVPAPVMAQAATLSPGFACLSRRAEWPAEWPGQAALPDAANAGLLLRLAGALFEIDRFLALPPAHVAAMVQDFRAATRAAAAAHGMALLPVGADDGGNAVPCLAASLITLDLGQQRPAVDFDAAAAIHRQFSLTPRADHLPMRIGQPVRARRRDDGRFAGTLRLSLSMPMLAEHAALGRAASQARFTTELAAICAAIAWHADALTVSQEAA